MKIDQTFPNQQELVELMGTFDTMCFPEEMHMTTEEREELFSRDITGILICIEGKTAGLCIFGPEVLFAEELKTFDPQFTTSQGGFYSYSVAVLPEFRRKRVASMLVLAMKKHVQEKGAVYLSTHTRISNHWNEYRAQLLEPQERRIVEDAWDEDGDVEYQKVVF